MTGTIRQPKIAHHTIIVPGCGECERLRARPGDSDGMPAPAKQLGGDDRGRLMVFDEQE